MTTYATNSNASTKTTIKTKSPPFESRGRRLLLTKMEKEGLTAAWLGRTIGCTRDTAQSIMDGRSEPKGTQIVALAALFGIPTRAWWWKSPERLKTFETIAKTKAFTSI